MHELKYKPSTRRWHAYRKGSYACPLHSGDLLALEVADRYLSCRMVYDTDWYVLIGETKFRLHRKAVYRVILLF